MARRKCFFCGTTNEVVLDVVEPFDIILCANCSKKLSHVMKLLCGEKLLKEVEKRVSALKAILESVPEDTPIAVGALKSVVGEKAKDFRFEELLEDLLKLGKIFMPREGYVRKVPF